MNAPRDTPSRRANRHVAVRGIVVSLVLLVVGGVGGLTNGWSDASFTHAASSRPVVALTFDDGLNDDYSEALANQLEARGMRGTFFVVADTLSAQDDLAQALVERGHLLANHSYDHTRASKTDLLYTQVSRAQHAFEQAIGKCPAFYRPPYGVQTPWVNAAVHRAGMQTVLWDVEVADWKETDPQRLAANVLAKTRPGAIILLHDGTDGHRGADRSVLVEALPFILDGLQARGLSAVTLDDLLGEPGYLEACP